MKKQIHSSVDPRQISAFEHLFFTWLISENLYEDFAKGLRSRGFKPDVRVYADAFFTRSCKTPFHILLAAFPWSESLQGDSFWREASSRWQAYLKNFINSLK